MRAKQLIILVLVSGCNAAEVESSTPDAAVTDAAKKPPPSNDASGTQTNDASAALDAPVADGSSEADATDDSATAIDSAPDAQQLDGGACSSNSDCVSAEYCEQGTGNCGGLGTCELRPSLCPYTYIPVCGCDSITYDNDCYARGAGQSILHDGACP